MDSSIIIDLENLIFKVKEKPSVAAQLMAGIIGVLIDLKPATIEHFEKGELKDVEKKKFEKLLDDLKLERVYFEYHHCLDGEKVATDYISISKKIELAKQTRDAFIELWSLTNDGSKILDNKKWAETTEKIGKLLGYPKTAIIDFISNDNTGDKDRQKRMARNYHYIHSAKYEEDEYKLYDQKLNRAISKYAPKTTSEMTKDKEKRWLD